MIFHLEMIKSIDEPSDVGGCDVFIIGKKAFLRFITANFVLY